jgi:hypothetical protein
MIDFIQRIKVTKLLNKFPKIICIFRAIKTKTYNKKLILRKVDCEQKL